MERWLRRPALPLAAALALTIFLGFGVPRVQTDAGIDLLIDTTSASFGDQARFADLFGGDPIVVEIEAQPGQELLTPAHMVGMAGMEGQLSTARGVKRVYGPGTLVNTFANEVTKRALDICAQQGKDAEIKAVADAKAAGKSSADQTRAGQDAFDSAVRACATNLAQQYPSLGLPAVDNPGFYGEVLLEPGGQQVRPFWAWALPDTRHAVIQVRMDRHASVGDVRAVLDRIDSQSHRSELKGVDVHVSGAPALAASLADAVQRSLIILLPGALVAMLLVTLLVIRVPLRLLAIPLAALAAAWTAGAAGWLSLPLTPATLAVLPVVLGLTTDYVIQAVNRLAEEPGPRAGARAASRVERTAAFVLPATGLAALATGVALLAFAISPIPLVRQFALTMGLGVACSWLVAMLVGLPLVAVLAQRARSAAPVAPAGPDRWAFLARAGRLRTAVLVPLAVAGLLGWAALPFLRVETDPVRLMPAGDHAVAEAGHVKQAVGLVGELDLVVTGKDVTSSEVVAWMDRATGRAAGPDLKPLTGLSTFLTAFNNGTPPDASMTQKILQNIPAYFTNAVVSPGHDVARSVFGITRETSVDADRALVARVEGTGPPPAGYRAYAAGLSVVAAGALDRMTRDQVLLNLLAIAVVLAVLGIAYRDPRRAVVAVLPTVVAAGWATGILFLSGLQASPITVLLAGVVVAFATEFSVLWLGRYAAERRAGADAALASETASRRVGPAIVASAAALAAGFAVLVLSPVPMVSGFGLVSGLDLLLATASVLVLLPPLARRILRPSTRHIGEARL